MAGVPLPVPRLYLQGNYMITVPSYALRAPPGGRHRRTGKAGSAVPWEQTAQGVLT